MEELVADAGSDLGAISPAQHVLVSDEDATGFLHAFGDRVPVVGAEATEVDELDIDALFAMDTLGGPGSNFAPPYIDGAMFATDDELILYG